jgi:hypothetical protein
VVFEVVDQCIDVWERLSGKFFFLDDSLSAVGKACIYLFDGGEKVV